MGGMRSIPGWNALEMIFFVGRSVGSDRRDVVQEGGDEVENVKSRD